MTAPDRIAAYWTAADNDTMPSQMLALTPKSPRFHDDMPKSQRIEYVRADLVDPTAIQEAARVLLTALHKAQIDMKILKLFYNGQLNTGLEALTKGADHERA